MTLQFFLWISMGFKNILIPEMLIYCQFCDVVSFLRGLQYLLCISDLGEEGLQLQSLYKQSPADGLVVLGGHTGVGEARCAHRHHLAECTHWSCSSLLLLLLFFLLLSTVPLIRCAVLGRATDPFLLDPSNHFLNEALQLWAELPLLAVVESPVQSLVDDHTKGLDQLEEIHTEVSCCFTANLIGLVDFL